MIFSELYSAYYNAVARVIEKILEGEKNTRELQRIVSKNAFEESGVAILSAIKNEKWHLISKDMLTPVLHKPTMPLTLLERRWLKAISLDPRIKLFGVEFKGLDDAPPLFTSDDYEVYDKYSDGDPYEDEEYVKKFRVILEAIRNGTQIKFEMTNRFGKPMFVRCHPKRIEYSEKDDKFRVVTAGWHAVSTVNIAKMRSCVHYTGPKTLEGEEREVQYDTMTLKVLDERNALERVMLHFAHFEKQAEKLDKKHYLVKIKYALADETEMVIRILSFGPLVEVIGSEKFRNLVIERLKKQKNCGLF
jgi:hypothetical protein